MPRQNVLLEALPVDERRRLLAVLEPITIERGHCLHDVGDRLTRAYFPSSGLISLISLTRDGQSLELAAVGADGFVAIETMLHVPTARHKAVAQLSCEALCLTVERLRMEAERSALLRRVLLRYAHTVLEDISQTAVCHRFHKVSQRLARWLLVTRDRLQSDVIHLSQEGVANLLGCPRTGVTTAGVMLQDRGAIRQRHGRTFIVDAARLREAACECYVAPSGSSKPQIEATLR